MRFVVLGDIHLYRLGLMPWGMVSKRVLGQTNLWLNRRHRFDGRLLGPTVERAREVNPEGVLLSGDLTTTALPGEFRDAAMELAPLLAGRKVTAAVPGNHDRYTFAAARTKRFERAMRGCVPSKGYPHVQHLTDRWRLISLDVARPTAISSRGRVGVRQLAALREALGAMTPEQGAVVLCHYPFAVPPQYHQSGWQHRLADAGALREALAKSPGQLLFIHGHVHYPWVWRGADGMDHVTDLNAGSPTLRTAEHPFGQGFWEVTLPDEGEPIAKHHVMQAAEPAAWDTIEA